MYLRLYEPAHIGGSLRTTFYLSTLVLKVSSDRSVTRYITAYTDSTRASSMHMCTGVSLLPIISYYLFVLYLSFGK